MLGPEPEQLEQLESQDWQDELTVSKNCAWLQVGRQRPFERTGRCEEQDVHWLKDEPEQVAQSGWQVTQEPDELNVFDGQLETQLPSEANWVEEAHVRQNVDEPVHVPHEESQADKRR